MASADSHLRIGLVLDTSLDPPDGVQQYVIHIGEWLRDQGHDVHYLVGETKNRQLPNVHSLARNIKVKFNGNETTIPLPTSKRKLKAFLQANKFDVLHVQVPHSPFMAQRLIMSADPSTAVIGTFHILPYGFLSNLGTKLLGIWLKPSLKRFDKMLAVSTAAAEFAQKSFGVSAEVCPNVIDYKLFKDAKALPKYNDDKLTILFLGRLVARKGCLTLLQAVDKLIRDHADLQPFKVLICGKGPLDSKLKQFTAEHNLSDIVEFTGFVSEEDKPRYYASADISAFPSSGGESFGIVLLEAMASGKSVVLAGNNPGYGSVMRDQPELLFNPNHPDELTQKLLVMISGTSKRNQLQDWGTNYASNFDTSLIGQKLLDHYNQALLKRSKL